MENGILKKSLLSLKKLELKDISLKTYRMAIVYKHYILFFRLEEQTEDCVVVDTQKGTAVNASTGLNLGARTGYSIHHWKHNIFVVFGGTTTPKTENPQKTANLFKELNNPVYGVQFLRVNDDENSRVTFSAENIGEDDQTYWNMQHMAQIYNDNLFVLGGKGFIPLEQDEVWKYDLNERKWGCCRTTGEASRSNIGSASALFENKIYLLGGFPKGLLGSGLFGKNTIETKLENYIYALNVENMQWSKISPKALLPTQDFYNNNHADVLGDKIYIRSAMGKEFFIFDPVKNTLERTEGLPPVDGFLISSYQERSILFRLDFRKDFSLEYQDFPQINKILGFKSSSSSPFLSQSRSEQVSNTRILSQSNHMDLLWKDKLFADVTFVVEDEEIPAHRNILVKCHYFLKMFTSGMKESNSDKISVLDISPVSFKAILEYIYFGKIGLTEKLAMNLLIIADMYCMAELKEDCENYLSTNMKAANLLEIIKAAETADSIKLENKIISFLSSYLERLNNEMDLQLVPPHLLVKCMLKMNEVVKGKK